MDKHTVLTGQEARIWSNPKFRKLVIRRSRFMWSLFGLTCLLFFSYCLVIAFAPSLLGIPLWQGAASNTGILAGTAVVLISFALTGIYVYHANRDFDRRVREILEESGVEQAGE